MNTLMAPDYLSDLIHTVEEPNEYLLAHRAGVVHDDCSAYEARCKLNIFEVGESIECPINPPETTPFICLV